MATKKKRTTREYDLDKGVMVMTKNGKDYKFSFNGLPSNVFMKLAMIGAGSILTKVDKPMAVWEKICQNRFGRERNYARVPYIVQAYSRVKDIPIEEAIKVYNSLSVKDKKTIKQDTTIKKELLTMKLESLE